MRRAAAALALVLLPTLASAEGIPLTLTEALARAESRNPGALAAAARATAQERQAEALARSSWPRVSVSTSWSQSDTPSTVFAQKLNAGDFTADDFAVSRLNSPAALRHLTTVASLDFPVDAFGKVRARERSQATSGQAAAALAREAVQDVRLRVIEAYRRAVLARRAVAVTESFARAPRAREEETETRVSEGAALAADLLRVRARRRQREAELAERRAEQAIAGAVFSRLVGAEPGTVYEPTEEPVAPEPMAEDAAAWTERALAHHPSHEAARHRLETARWALRAERRSGLPDLALSASLLDDRSTFSGGARSWAVGAGLRWTAFDPSRAKRLASADAFLAAAEHDTRATLDEVFLGVESAWHRAQATRERYLAAQGGAEEGREALRVVQERRRAGKATLTDELETEAAALDAELAEVQAAAEASLADSVLRRTAGEL